MLGGNKPWVKALAENPLLILSIFGLVATRIAGKIIDKDFNDWNLVALSISFLGLIFLIFSKKEQLKKKEFFKFGLSAMNEKEKSLYKIGYILMVVGIFLTFFV